MRRLIGATTVWISAVVQDQAPSQKAQYSLAGVVVFADHIKELARRRIVGRRLRAAVGYINPLNNRET